MTPGSSISWTNRIIVDPDTSRACYLFWLHLLCCKAWTCSLLGIMVPCWFNIAVIWPYAGGLLRRVLSSTRHGVVSFSSVFTNVPRLLHSNIPYSVLTVQKQSVFLAYNRHYFNHWEVYLSRLDWLLILDSNDRKCCLRLLTTRDQARVGERTVGSIVCKAEKEMDDDPYTGYIAMLAVDTTYRKHGIGERV